MHLYNDDTVIDPLLIIITILTPALSRDEVTPNFGYNPNGNYGNTLMLIIQAGTTQHMMLAIFIARIGLQTATAKLKTTVYTESDPCYGY